MADKSINELVAASGIGATDLFVLQQDNTAKKLPGQVLLNWLTAAADGHGGIQSWVPLKTEGRVTTFRITLADKTYIDIDVVDGRGIEDLKKIKTEGLVDTYQIIYNDGPPSTFTVTNGAKGDPGNDANVWIRYASQKPTADSHSFGEIPDAWIGIAPGHLLTAPTDWQAYTWYQWKGEKGDTGDPAKRLSVTYAYQVGDTGNIIPSGTWQATIPNVPQGKFLWIRKTTTWNSGDPDVDYSISRMGLDGSGSVSSVADISPDENGNVQLTAEHIGALPNTGGDMAGAINMKGHKIKGLNAPTEDDEPATKGYAVAKERVVNNFTTTEEGFVADARTVKILNDNIRKISAVQESNPGSVIDITFGSYATAALIFAVGSGSTAICYLYSNGYITPLKTTDKVTVELSGDYKTITVTNMSGSGIYTLIGVAHLGTTSMTVNTRG